MGAITKLNDKEKAQVCQELRDKIGPGMFLHEEIDVIPYSYDASTVPFQKPSIVVLPENKECVREALKIANKYKIPVTVTSAGTNVSGQCIPLEGGMVLDMRRMSKI